ncbi:hypothetical protein JAAARDRAFT_175961 [Jaapia argillacea MUCL 33604]|uniref:Store-operated calcium entry-associated regulatory factor n=1 Tax=Jaapia argillacea MUCL 33604 TaxID=933084 RepID=A0A067Q9C5_9AGAM|nr:hypothetical protein JAAARDRAFT_175961 [Jaapia argillacea MUCL 33604]
MSRIALTSIPALTFYKGSLTESRRTSPIAQLKCIGAPCKLYTPEVVRCVNLGGSGTEVDWKCEADLPETLRFGRVEVSCEGYSKPGDPYVLKGSCGLEYRLVEIPRALRNEDTFTKSPITNWFSKDNIGATIFTILWTSCLLFILYHFLKSLFSGPSTGTTGTPRPPRPPGSTPGHFGWSHDDSQGGYGARDPPPPYTKSSYQSSPASSQPGWSNWQPGFWSGAALGGLAASMWGRSNNRGREAETTRTRAYDWEREPVGRASGSGSTFGGLFSGSGAASGSRRTDQSRDDDRGEGSSNLGATRRSTAFGGSSVR